MPKFQFLKENQEFNKETYKVILHDLLNEATRNPIEEDEVKKTFDEMEIDNANEKLKFFVDKTKKNIDSETLFNMINQMGLDIASLRENVLSYYRNVLSNYYILQSEEVNQLIALLKDKNQNQNMSLEAIKERILPLIKEEY